MAVQYGFWGNKMISGTRQYKRRRLEYDKNRKIIKASCNKCDEMLPPSSFVTNNGDATGLYAVCKPCQRWHQIGRDHGISPRQWEELYAHQEGRCKICRHEMTETKDAHLDHCHTTGRIIALLCFSCNSALGKAGENPSILSRMMDYVSKYKVSKKELGVQDDSF